MNKSTSKIVLIGAGQLGCRHLESLKEIKLEVEIFVIDVSEDSLLSAKKTAELLKNNNLVKKISFSTSVLDLPKLIDILIVATNANVRYSILREVSRDRTIKNCILEKVLFQSENDFLKAKELVGICKIRTWVNCPRRIYDCYHRIKSVLFSNDCEASVYGVLSGGDWALGSNAIHYIDIFAFLVQCDSYVIDVSGLDRSILDSKRPGYLEVTGTLVARFSNGSVLTLSSRRNSSEQAYFTIVKSGVTVCLKESNNFVRFFNAEVDVNVSVQEEKIRIPYQSELTSHVVEDILMKSTCGLTTFEESIRLHLPLINSLQSFFKENYNRELNCCPIT